MKVSSSVVDATEYPPCGPGFRRVFRSRVLALVAFSHLQTRQSEWSQGETHPFEQAEPSWTFVLTSPPPGTRTSPTRPGRATGPPARRRSARGSTDDHAE